MKVESKNAGISTKFLIALILAVIMGYFVLNFATIFSGFMSNFSEREMEKVDEAFTKVVDGANTGYPVTIKLPDDSAFFLIEPLAWEITVKNDGRKLFSYQRPSLCSFKDQCICYCDRIIQDYDEIKKDYTYKCKEGRLVCSQITEKTNVFVAKTPERLFDESFKKPSSFGELSFEGGIILMRGGILSLQADPDKGKSGIASAYPNLNYKTRLYIQKIQLSDEVKIVMCVRSGDEKCGKNYIYSGAEGEW